MALAEKIKAIFASMRDGSKTNTWMAQQIASEIKADILARNVTTTDIGAAPAGAYAGAGTGTMTISNSDLQGDLKDTFEAAYDNNNLAAHMATDIDAASTASDTVATDTTGTVTTPAGATSQLSGKGKGKFTGTKSSIESLLKTCFAAMNNMSSGGDDYLAAQIAAAEDAYLKAGTVNVTLQSPLTGSGTGAIA